MEMLKKVNGLMLGLAVLLAASCGKEDDTPPQNDPKAAPAGCVPATARFYDSYGTMDWAYVYNAQGQVIKAISSRNNTPVQAEQISYSATGKITWIKYYALPAKRLVRKIQLQYNADSLVSKEINYTYSIPGDTNSLVPGSERTFDYDAGKRLTRITSGAPSPAALSFKIYTYTQPDKLTEETYYGTPMVIGWRNEIQYLPNAKVPGDNVAYFKLPPGPEKSGGFMLNGLLAVSVKATQFVMGDPVSEHNYGYTYNFNAQGYPTEQILPVPGQQPKINYWTYNCR